MATSATQPAARGDGRAEPDERRIVGVALGDGRGPTLPIGVERRQLVHGVEPVVAGQDLGTPGRVARTRLEQGHLGLPGGELAVERRVGRRSREPPPSSPMPAATISDRSGPGSGRRDDAEREDRRPRDPERAGEVDARCPPLDQREAEHEQAQPDHEERHHGRRAHEARAHGRAPRSRGASGPRARADHPRTRASARMAGDDVTRGTTRAVNTLHAVSATRKMPATRANGAGDRLHAAHVATSAAGRRRGSARRAASRAAGPPAATSAAGHRHRPRAQQLAEPLGLRVQAEVRRHPPAQDPVHDEVHRTQIGQRVAAHRERLRLGQQGHRAARRCSSSASQSATASSSAQSPMLASPPLSPERAPTSITERHLHRCLAVPAYPRARRRHRGPRRAARAWLGRSAGPSRVGSAAVGADLGALAASRRASRPRPPPSSASTGPLPGPGWAGW